MILTIVEFWLEFHCKPRSKASNRSIQKCLKHILNRKLTSFIHFYPNWPIFYVSTPFKLFKYLSNLLTKGLSEIICNIFSEKQRKPKKGNSSKVDLKFLTTSRRFSSGFHCRNPMPSFRNPMTSRFLLPASSFCFDECSPFSFLRHRNWDLGIW